MNPAGTANMNNRPGMMLLARGGRLSVPALGLLVGLTVALLSGIGYASSQNDTGALPWGQAVGKFQEEPGSPSPQLPLDFLGEDTIFCFGLLGNVVGTHGDDLLIGTPGDDVIAARGGNDIIAGLGGEDLICGGSGDDQIFGGPMRDIVLAGTGDDIVIGGPGNDTLLGDNGNDHLTGSGGHDFLSGSRGDDVLIGGIMPHEQEDHPRLVPRDIFLGGLGNDIMVGGDGNDAFLAFSGDDIVIAAGGNDLVAGFSGDDHLDGGPGPEDECRGGPGADAAANCEIMSDIELEHLRSYPAD